MLQIQSSYAVTYLAVGATIVLYGLWSLLCIERRPLNYLPGPPTVPILGNLLQVYHPAFEGNQDLSADFA